MAEEKVIDIEEAKKKKDPQVPGAQEKGKFADQTINNTSVDGMAVRTYTLNDSSDSLYRVLTEEEIARREAEYERRNWKF